MMLRNSTSNPVGGKTYYSKFVILVCNVPAEGSLNKKMSLTLEAARENWKLEHNDPLGERFHIIYLHKSDSVKQSKFAPLRDIDHNSRIYIVGHCKPGADSISSEDIYNDGAGNYVCHHFSYRQLGDILIHNISNPKVACDFDYLSADEGQSFAINVNSQRRRLRICVASCHSAADVMVAGQPRQASFCEKFANYLFNINPHKLVKCDVIGNKDYVAPLPMRTDASIADLYNFVVNNQVTMTDEHKPVAFHKRHYQSFPWSLMFGETYKPSRDYKVTFCIKEGTSYSDLINHKMEVVCLGTKASIHRLDMQIVAEKIMTICSDILDRCDQYAANIVELAESNSSDVEQGVFYEASLVQQMQFLLTFVLPRKSDAEDQQSLEKAPSSFKAHN